VNGTYSGRGARWCLASEIVKAPRRERVGVLVEWPGKVFLRTVGLPDKKKKEVSTTKKKGGRKEV